MSTRIRKLIHVPASQVARLSFVLASFMVLLACFLLAGEADLSQRIIILRMWTFILAGFFAFITPHLLYPEHHLGWIQLMNPAPGVLWSHQLYKMLPLTVLTLLSLAILAFFDPQSPAGDLHLKSMTFLQYALLATGVLLYACYRYGIIGELSQQWHEGQRGNRLMEGLREAGQAPSVPPGMFPSFGATVSTAGIGMLLVVLGAWLQQQTAAPAGVIPPLLLIGWSVARTTRITPVYDRHFYHTNAFYTELFKDPKAHGQEGRQPISYEAVYWTPHRWRAAVQASLIQLDRMLPMGRIIFLMVLFLWTLFLLNMSTQLITGWLLLMITAKNATCYMLTRSDVGPLPFQLLLGSPAHWIACRFFVNIRWTLSLVLALALVAVLSPEIGTLFVLFWGAVDLLFSFAAALTITAMHEFQYRKQYE